MYATLTGTRQRKTIQRHQSRSQQGELRLRCLGQGRGMGQEPRRQPPQHSWRRRRWEERKWPSSCPWRVKCVTCFGDPRVCWWYKCVCVCVVFIVFACRSEVQWGALAWPLNDRGLSYFGTIPLFSSLWNGPKCMVLHGFRVCFLGFWLIYIVHVLYLGT